MKGTEPASTAQDDILPGARRICTRNNRICPQPIFWDRLWQMLPNPGHSLDLMNPLILGGWWHSTDEQKKERLAHHLQWAAGHNVLPAIIGFLEGLTEEQWHHYRE